MQEDTIDRQRPPRQASSAIPTMFTELLGAGWRALAKLRAALAEAQRMARTRRELHALSDHFLRDIGIDRRQIDRLFR